MLRYFFKSGVSSDIAKRLTEEVVTPPSKGLLTLTPGLFNTCV